MSSSLEQVRHLIPHSERPTGFEASERLIVEKILCDRKSIGSVIKINKRVDDMNPPSFEQVEPQACTG